MVLVLLFFSYIRYLARGRLEARCIFKLGSLAATYLCGVISPVWISSDTVDLWILYYNDDEISRDIFVIIIAKTS